MKIVENSLIIAKLKMKLQTCPADKIANIYLVNINYDKSMYGFPVLSLNEKKV